MQSEDRIGELANKFYGSAPVVKEWDTELEKIRGQKWWTVPKLPYTSKRILEGETGQCWIYYT